MSLFRKLGVVGVAISILTSTVAAQANDRNFSINNYSSRVIEDVYVSPSWSENWGRDQLGSSVLYSGDIFYVYNNGEWSGTCYFDVKLVDDRGREYVYSNVDACSVWSVNHY